MDNMSHQIFEDFTRNMPLPDYSLLEVAGSFATVFTMLVVSLVLLVGGLLSIGAAVAFALTMDRKFLPTALAPLLVGGVLYGVLLAGGFTSLGLWSGVVLVGLSYPLLKRRSLRRAANRIAGSA